MKKRSFAGLLLATTALGLPAHAQVPPPPATQQAAAPVSAAGRGTEEVVVTAQKRSERIQKVPINITAISAKAIQQAGITSPQDLQRVAPSFHFTTSLGSLATRFSLRGVGTFSNSAIEPSVASFVDGIYIPRPASIVSSLLDVQQIEVLSGPQGTLFGRNASAGAVTYRSAPPTGVFSDDAKFDYSTGNHFRIENVLNIPVNDKVSVRLAGLGDFLQGYWKDDLNGKSFGGVDTYQFRGSVKMQVTDDITWTVRADYNHTTGDNALNFKLVPSSLTPTTLKNFTAKNGGIVPNLDEFSTHNNFYDEGFFDHDSIGLISSDLAWTLGNGYTFRLLDGYNDWLSNQGDGDTAFLSAYTVGRHLYYHSQSNSHELQFISPPGLLGGRLNFVGGLYYFHEGFDIIQDSLDGPNFCNIFSIALSPAARLACPRYDGPNSTKSSEGNFVQQTDSEAAYTQATFKILPQVALTAGLRYTDEQKDGTYVGTDYNFTGAFLAAPEHTKLNLDSSRFTYRANIAYTPTDNIMLFGTASTGFKSGGFNNGIATIVLGQAREFQPETVLNYELGIKSQFLDNLLTLNATLFHDHIDNFQERSLIGTTSNISNVGQVRQEGVELQAAEQVLPWLSFNQGIDYIDSDVLSDCKAPIPAYLKVSPADPYDTELPRCPGAPLSTQNLAGAPLTYNPRWQGIVGGQIDGRIPQYDMRWTLNADLDFYTKQYEGFVIDKSPLTIQPGYALLNARATLWGPQDKWSVGVYGRNLTDKGYCTGIAPNTLDSLLGVRTGYPLPAGTAFRCSVGVPLVVGVTLTAHF